jgi:hypothetical protein
MSRYDRWGRAEMPEGETLRQIQRGINETMAAVVVDRYNPVTSLPSSGTVTLPNAPRVTDLPETVARRSDRDTIDLRSRPSYADAVVGAMIDAAFPPPPPAPLVEGLAAIRASIEAIPSATRKEMLLRSDLKPKLREMLEEAERGA